MLLAAVFYMFCLCVYEAPLLEKSYCYLPNHQCKYQGMRTWSKLSNLVCYKAANWMALKRKREYCEGKNIWETGDYFIKIHQQCEHYGPDVWTPEKHVLLYGLMHSFRRLSEHNTQCCWIRVCNMVPKHSLDFSHVNQISNTIAPD